jgi:hypothetical protein
MSSRGAFATLRALAVLSLLPGGSALSQVPVPKEILATTLVAKETSSWFYADGIMKESGAEYELTFEVTDSSLIRRLVRNFKSGDVVVDDTEYHFITSLAYHQRAKESLRFKRLSDSMRALVPAVRAIGRPGADAVEIIWIGPDWFQSVKTVKDYMVITRYIRTQ